MKKLKSITSFILAAAMTCCAIPVSVSAEGAQPVKDKYATEEAAIVAGLDFNNDGMVSYSDLRLMTTFSAYAPMLGDISKITEYIDSACAEAILAAGDLNGDGKINAADGTYMLIECSSLIHDGDLNEDGKVDPVDAALLLTHYAKIATEDSGYKNTDSFMICNAIGDIDGDGVITPADATEILWDYCYGTLGVVR